ncbi:MAG: AzlD domain-containing protein [Chloroflexota bacterium]
MTDFALVLMVAGGTFLMRASLVVMLANATIPERVQQALRLVAPAVLAGLVAQTLFITAGDVRPFGTWYIAAAIAALVAWRTRSVGWTLLMGMVAVWALQLVGP